MDKLLSCVVADFRLAEVKMFQSEFGNFTSFFMLNDSYFLVIFTEMIVGNSIEIG